MLLGINLVLEQRLAHRRVAAWEHDRTMALESLFTGSVGQLADAASDLFSGMYVAPARQADRH